MCIMTMYTTTCTSLVHINKLVLLGLTGLLMCVGVMLVPQWFTRLITLITLVTFDTLLLIIFLQTLRIGHTLVKTLDLEGAVVDGVWDIEEAMALMLEGLERSFVHRDKMAEGKWFGR